MTLRTVEELAAQARAAYDSFRGKLAAAQAAARSGRGAAVGSDAWAAASVALAGLETERSRTMIPLADLDRLVVAASTEGQSTEGLADVQVEVERMVEEETSEINQIHAALSQ